MAKEKIDEKNPAQPQRRSRRMTFMEYEEMMHRYAEYFNKFGN